MDLWGPYLPERAWGNNAPAGGSTDAENSSHVSGGRRYKQAQTDAADSGFPIRFLGGAEPADAAAAAAAAGASRDDNADATYEEARRSGKFLDGIFGFGSACGTARAAFAFWNGADAHLKERLFDAREMYQPGAVDPQYRYFSCRYAYPQEAFPYDRPQTTLARDRAFGLQFQLAKETPTRMFYQVTVTNGDKDRPADLTVASLLWLCHADCGRIERQSRDKDCLQLSSDYSCRRQPCPHPEHLCAAPAAKNIGLNYRLHYQSKSLQTVAFSTEGQAAAFDRLIVHADRSLLSAADHGSRVALVYRLSLPPGASACLRFLLASAAAAPADSTPPDWAAVPDLMRRAAAGATEQLTASIPAELPPAVRKICQRAYSCILWNRQLCPTDGLPPPTVPAAATSASAVDTASAGACLMVVPDKWHRPVMATWEHALHAIVLCRLRRELAVEELSNQLARLSINGELAYAAPAPPVWPLALLEFFELHQDKDTADRIFLDLMRHLNWWLIERRDANDRNTLDGGILGLEHHGWMEQPHASETNDSLVWSGFFCAKMVHLAAQLNREELKSLLDLFNAALSSRHNDVAFLAGLFKPSAARDCQQSATGSGPTTTSCCCCCCAFGLVPLLGCASIHWDLVTPDRESTVLIEWLQWLSNVSGSGSSDAPTLFVRTEANSRRFLLSWLSEAEFLQLCGPLLDPDHFLSPYGIRCTSRSLRHQMAGHGGGGGGGGGGSPSACSLCRGGDGSVSVPLNYLVLEALKCWETVYGQSLQLEFPTGSGSRVCLNDIIVDLSQRVVNIFLNIATSSASTAATAAVPDAEAEPPPMFHERYCSDTGQGVGGGRRTSWSSLVANIALNLTRQPTLALHSPPVMPGAVGRILPRSSVVSAVRHSLRSSFKLEDFDWGADW